MPLNLHASSGEDFVPYISFDAKAGRWFIKVDGSKSKVEVPSPVLAFDFANIKTGWIFFPPAGSGSGPEKVWDPSLSIEAPKPNSPKAFKRGFEVLIHAPGSVGVREFSSTASSTIAPILEMYNNVYEPNVAANPGKVPVFACVGVTPVESKFGTNYSPVFKLQQWVPRASIPFDGGGPSNAPSTNGHGLPQWAMPADALAAAAPYSITREQVLAAIAAVGGKGWDPARDSPIVHRLIHDAKEMGRGEMPGSPPGRDESEIPFVWLVPMLFPFLGMMA